MDIAAKHASSITPTTEELGRLFVVGGGYSTETSVLQQTRSSSYSFFRSFSLLVSDLGLRYEILHRWNISRLADSTRKVLHGREVVLVI